MAIRLYTIDVGHGLCQVIRFGDRAILIDGGGKLGKRVAEDFLKRYIRVILAYVATHNDADHVGAAVELLDHYQSAATLNSIWLLVDRPARRPADRDEDVIPLLGYSKRRLENGTLGQRRALYVRDDLDNMPTLIHREEADGAELQLIHPRALDTSAATIRREPDAVATNQACAILRFVLDTSKSRASVLLTGDANCESFRLAHDVYRFDLAARTLCVPHHGGAIPRPVNAPDWDTVVGWIDPEIAIVSAGFGTVPRSTATSRATFDSLRRPGITTCCTQITAHCHPQFRNFHPSVRPLATRPLPQMSGRTEFPDAVGCAGTMTMDILPNGDVRLIGHHAHQLAVNQKIVPAPGCPHCRP